MDHCVLVFIKKIYTIIMCLYYIDLSYDVICYTNIFPLGYDEPCRVGLVDPHFVIMYLPTGIRWAMNGVNWAGWSTYTILFGSTYPTTAILYNVKFCDISMIQVECYIDIG